MLTLTFPRLRIIWSASPYGTSDIFAELKANNSEPNSETAASIGAEDAQSHDAYREGYENAFNPVPQEMLRSMPGLNDKNYRYVMRKVTNIEELAQMPAGDIAELIGDEASKQLEKFISEDSVNG